MPSKFIGKVHEELDEVAVELEALPQAQLNDEQAAVQDCIEDEIGDLLFAVVNLARHAKVNPETATRTRESEVYAALSAR